MKFLNFLLVIMLALSLAVIVAMVREHKKAANHAQSPAGQLQSARDMMDVVERASKIARDPTGTGVTAVFVAGTMLKQRSPSDAIEFWTKTLPETHNDAVRRAIRAQLVELYKQTNQPDAALEQLRTLITAAPGAATETATAH